MGFKCQRWTLANLLPVFFVFWIIGSIWGLYVTLHLMYLLQIWRPAQPGVKLEFSESMWQRGVLETCISQFLTLMLAICFWMAISTDPGSVPEDSEWMPGRRSDARDEDYATHTRTSEVKHTGAPRYCKWCECYKPDRCHHCRVCRSCILRMDHHCPWIANCVGFRNHKYFLLLVFYSLSCCVFISCTMTESLHRVLFEETTFPRRFLVVFGVTLSVMMGVLLMLFFMLHIWLVWRATTTIEFCEKAYKRAGADSGTVSLYDTTPYENIKAVLGHNPLFWLVPCAGPEGDGLQFATNDGDDKSSSKSDVGDGRSGSSRSASCSSVPSSAVARPKANSGNSEASGIPPEVTGQGRD